MADIVYLTGFRNAEEMENDDCLVVLGKWGVDHHSIPITEKDEEEGHEVKFKIADIPDDIKILSLTIHQA